jgi:hypothetical protein
VNVLTVAISDTHGSLSRLPLIFLSLAHFICIGRETGNEAAFLSKICDFIGKFECFGDWPGNKPRERGRK